MSLEHLHIQRDKINFNKYYMLWLVMDSGFSDGQFALL